MSYPLISFVLCTYDGENFLQEQIDSLLKQTYPAIEIIISDDASTDATVSILLKYKTHSAIKLFFQKINLGPVKNFEFAIQQTSGKFIAFSDQDDIWLPGKIKRMYTMIGESYLIYSDSKLINEKGVSLYKNLSDLRQMYSGDKTMGFVFSNVVWGHAMLVNRQLLSFVVPIPLNIPHDIWMAFRAATLTGIKYLDEPLTKYRQHAATVTKTIAVKAKRGSGKKRYADFKKQLYWIGIMRDYERPAMKPFYAGFYDLYAKKASGRFSWKLFFFMLRNRRNLFIFTRKKWISQVIELLKQARGESG